MSEDRAAAALDAALQRARAEARRDAGARPDADEATRRLDALLVALEPALARLPEADLFDVGLMRGAGPGAAVAKLCLDMAGRVEWRDAYVLSRLTPRGRVSLGQADDLDGAVDLVCDYLARRIVSRERAGPARDDADDVHGSALDRDASRWPADAREPRRSVETRAARDASPRETALTAFAREAGLRVESQETRDRRQETHAERQEARERRLARRDGRGAAFEATREAELRAEREAMIVRRERARLERARGRRDDAPWDDHDDDAPRSSARARVAENAAGADVGREGRREPEARALADEAAPETRSRRGWRARLGARLGALWPRGRLRRVSDRVARRRIGASERALVFAVQFLGSAALTLIVALTAWWAWRSAGLTLPK